MTQSLRQIKNRIRSIESTEKVTSAMEMISAAKLHRIDNTLASIKPYFLKLESLFNDLASDVSGVSNPFLEQKSDKGKITLCVITSDGGLCGVYNINIIRLAEEFINKAGKDKINLVVIGRKGVNHFKKQKMNILNSFTELRGRYSRQMSDEIADNLIDIFSSGSADEIYIAHMHTETSFIYKPVLIKFLNIDIQRKELQEAGYILEPGKEEILQALIPRYLRMKMRRILLESFVSEHTSRMVAMKTATDNADDLLKSLVLLRNKIRQAGITSDIMEIISASEAVKG